MTYSWNTIHGKAHLVKYPYASIEEVWMVYVSDPDPHSYGLFFLTPKGNWTGRLTSLGDTEEKAAAVAREHLGPTIEEEESNPELLVYDELDQEE